MPALAVRLMLTCLLAALVMGASSPCAIAQEDDAPAADQPRNVTFSFKGASIDQVLDFFSRETGLPVIREATVPDETVTFISERAYPFDEALRILNTILQTRGVMLRLDDEFLYLQTLDNMKAEAVPTFAGGEIPNDIGPDAIISVLMPLNNAPAAQLAERLSPLVAEYGAIVALPEQNAVLITETAAQCRRLAGLIQTIDAKPLFEESVQAFKIQHVPAEDLLESLKVLVAERQRTVFIDERGKRREIAEDELQGVRLQADNRTNSIIALGPEGRLQTVSALIEILDVPAGSGASGSGRVMRTFAVDVVPPEQAKRVLEAMFAAQPENRRPTIVPLEPAGKVTVLGDAGDVERVGKVLAELEGRSADELAGGDRAMTARLVPLEHVEAQRAIETVQRLLAPRQQRVVRLAPTPDGEGVLIAASSADAQMAEQLLRSVDVERDEERDVRVLTFERAVTEAALEEARTLDEAAGGDNDVLVRRTADDRSLTLVGEPEAIERYANTLRTVLEASTLASETRSYTLEKTRPSSVGPELAELAPSLLVAEGIDGAEPPRAEAVDALSLLIVTASPEHFGVIDDLVARLDAPRRAARSVKIVDVGDADARRVAERAQELFDLATVDVPEAERGEVSWSVDDATGKIILAGDDAGVSRFEGMLSDALELTPPPAGAEFAAPKLFPLRTAEASAMARMIADQYDRRTPEERREKPLEIRADGATNTLIVSAHPDVLQEIESIVADLNQQPSLDDEDREIRIFPLRIARAEELARTLDEMFPQPPVPVDRRGRPRPELRPQREVIVRADRQTNALIVDAPAKRMVGFEELVRQLDRAELGGDVELRTFRVEHADPSQVAETLRRLASSGGLTPGGNGSRSAPVQVDVAPQTRTLIVTGPTEAFGRVEQVLADLDASQTMPETRMQFFTLTNARAERARPIIERVLNSRLDRWTSEQGLTGEAASNLLEVLDDPATNTLIVTAPEAMQDTVRELVAQLDSGGARVAEVVRVMPLKSAEARDAAQAIERSLAGRATPTGGEVRVTAAESSNALVVSGAADDVEFVRGLLTELDRPSTSASVGVRTIVLKHARAERVAPLVERLLQSERLSGWMLYNMRLRNPQATEDAPVRAEADARANAVVITGPPEVLPVAEQLVAQLDTPAGQGGLTASRPVRVMPLRNADAREVAQNLEAVFADEATGEPAPVIRVDTGANALIVRASEEQFADVERLVQDLDGASLAGGRELRRVTVDRSRTDAAELARTLGRLLRERGGMQVEVISAEQLIAPQAEDDKAGEETPEAEDADEEARSKILLPRRTRMVLKFVQVVTVMQDDGADTSDADSRAVDRSDDDDADVTIAVDPETNALVLIGSSRATRRAAELARLLQEEMPASPGRVRIVALPEGVPAWNVARIADQTVRRLGRLSDDNPGGLTGPVSIVADNFGGSVVVSSNDADFEVIGPLIGSLAQPQSGAEVSVRLYELDAVDAGRAARSVREIVSPPGVRRGERVEMRLPRADGSGEDVVSFRSGSVRATPGPSGLSLIVTGPSDVMPLVDRFIERIDESGPTSTGMIRRYELDNASAREVSRTLRDVFESLRRSTPRGSTRQATFVPDERTNSMLVTATDEQHEEIVRLLGELDRSAEADNLRTELFTLDVADPNSVARVVESVLVGRDEANRERISVRGEGRLGLLVVRGNDADLDRASELVAELDSAESSEIETVSIKLERADADAVARALQRFFDDKARVAARPGQRPQRRIAVSGDRRTSTVVVSASAEELAQVRDLVETFDAPAEAQDLQFRVLALEHARVNEILETVQRLSDELQFMNSPWYGGGREGEMITIEGDARNNAIVLLGRGESFGTIEEIVRSLDVPEPEQSERVVRTFKVERADLRVVQEAAREAFTDADRARRWWEPQDPTEPTFTIDRSARTLVVIGPEFLMDEIGALVERLDSAGGTESVRVKNFALGTARAGEIARTLRDALGLDARGRRNDAGPARRFTDDAGNDVEVKAEITADERSNSILVTADDESMALIEGLIAQLDEQPTVSEREYRKLALEHVMADDVAQTLRTLVGRRPSRDGSPAPSITSSRSENALLVSATAAQFAEIRSVLEEIDVPSQSRRVTEFVPLQFADAEQVRRALNVFYGRFASAAETPGARNVSIVADPASNSLVISAEPEEWPGIRELVGKLDAEDYDASRQLEVIALKHADARSLAAALNRAFEAPLRAELKRERQRERRESSRDGFGDFFSAPAQLVEADDVVSVSAEPLTNTLIVSAGRRDIERVRAIVDRLDVPEYAALDAPVILPVAGDASAREIAGSLRQMYERRGNSGREGRGSVFIVGDDSAGVLLVRADAGQLEEIRALADQLARATERSGVTTRVLAVQGRPAAQVRDMLRATCAPMARSKGEQFSVEADVRGNALIIAASAEMYEEAERIVRELGASREDDEDAPPVAGAARRGGEGGGIVKGVGFGQTLVVIELENASPQQVVQSANQLGLTSPSPPDRPGLLAEPITVTPLTTRRAVALLVSPAESAAAEAIIRVLDAEPTIAEQEVAIVPLRVAQASQVARAVERMLDAEAEGARTAIAGALAEQVRRLRVRGERIDDRDLAVDLSKPIRVLVEEQTNAVVIASTRANVVALRELVTMLDRLPVGDAVVVRIFHLENAPAQQAAGTLRELFSRGEALRRTPGTELRGLPTTETGKALIGEVAVSVDERTNALIIAGREEAVAFAEVLVGELDADREGTWVEWSLVPLRFADAARVAETVNQVLVEGAASDAAAASLRRQVGRLRVMRDTDGNGEQTIADDTLESDLFVSMSRLTVLPEPTLNALIVMGSPANVEVVEELVGMLDVEGASRFETVRLYPLDHASADRVADLLEGLFQEQERSGTLREEDRAIIRADLRTNALVVATSPRSFAVIEALLRSLDVEEGRATVGLHVVPVPRGDVSALAQRISRVMNDRLRALQRDGGSRRDVISIEADEASSSLIVAASRDNLETIRELVTLLSSEDVAGDQRVEVIALELAKASEIAPLLEELYVDEANRTRGRGTVRVTPDQRLNAIVIAGEEEDITRLTALVERLDVASLNAVREIEIIELNSANALEMVNLLENVLSGRSLAGSARDASRQATLLRFVRERAAEELGDPGEPEPTETEVSAAIRERVTLTPDLRTNSIVVAAPPPMMVMLKTMIRDLDSSASGSRDIRVFALENADAQNMGEILRDLFNLRRQGNLYVLVPTGAPQPSGAPSDELARSLGMGDVTLSVVPDERQALSITVDPRTNSLLVSGTPQYLELVAGVVEQLDEQTGTERERFTVELKNARAEEVAGALQTFIDQEQDRIERALGPDSEGSALRRLEREISVVGVPGSNRLIVSVSPRYRETVATLIDELDRPPAQVLIQVLLAEVTLDSEDSWGIDFQLNPVGSLAYGGSLRAGGTGVLTAVGVPNISVSSLDFELLVRALEVQGRLEVLSRPQILVNNNEPAEIQVGEEIQLVTDVERLDNGNIRSDVTPRRLGVVLEVQPSISSDGFVRLDIAPEISALTARTTQVSEDFSAPVISQRRADTTVTVQDGQTIVIGGLIQTNSETRISKVPFIGDIPVLGMPFRSERTTNTKTELLIILTPRVILTDQHFYAETMQDITKDEVDRLSLPRNIRESLRSNTVLDSGDLFELDRSRDEQNADEPVAPGSELDDASQRDDGAWPEPGARVPAESEDR